MTTIENAPRTRLIPLGNKHGSKHGDLYAVVDEADYVDLICFNWHARLGGHTFYAQRNVRRPDGTWTLELMHRRLLPDARIVDHINGNGLDNRRGNLRPATHAENLRNRRGRQLNNTSGYIGVRWRGDRGKWRSEIVVDGQCLYLGLFPTAKEAAVARDRAALELHGAFARLNFPALAAAEGGQDAAA